MNLLELLRRIEKYGRLGCCPECKFGTKWNSDHADGCELKAVIDQLEAQEKEAVRAALDILEK